LYSHLEDYIAGLYQSLSISRPDQLNVNDLSKKLQLNIYYSNVSFRIGNNIVLQRSNKQQEWQAFGHELGHYLRHNGNQLTMHYLFRDLQEYQANYFAYHFCVPTFMLEKLKGVTNYDVMNLFNVEYEFAMKRLEMYERKMLECIANK